LDFKKGATSRSITLDPDLESNDGQILTAAALAGGGVLVQPRYIVQEYLASGQLVSVLNEWDLPRLTINIAFQTRRYMPAKTRIFIDYLIEHFREQDYERLWTS
jgi:DNA-binding transcriptional LysR family regulator